MPTSKHMTGAPVQRESLPWTHEDRTRPMARRLHDVARHFPSNVAITDGDHIVTYEELIDRSERIAGAIIERNDGKPVALLFEHESAMVIAVCGAWLAQTPYVALDATYPIPSLDAVLASAGSSLILTTADHQALAAELAGDDHTTIDIDALGPVSGPATEHHGELSPDAVSALFFTSGSTGAPKGVMRTEKYLLFRTAYEAGSAGFGPNDRIGALRPFVHGASSTSLTNSLLNGGSLRLYRPRQHGAHGLTRWVRDQQITEIAMPVMLLRAWVDLSRGERFPDVRQVGVASGRALWNDIMAIRALCPDAKVRSGYSSAETGFVSRMLVDPQMSLPGTLVPVGTLVPETSLELVDTSANTVSDGEPGLALVTSPHVSPGYWGDSEATGRVFSTDPADPHRRTFRTGDLLRWNEQGLLEFVERQDSRARVRGYRVSPSFVATALADQAAVADAEVVVDRQGSNDELVAYYVPSGAHDSTPAEVRRSLAARLPHYMIPSRLVSMAELPALPNGKIDQRRLVQLAAADSGLDGPGHEWNDDVEGQIAAIWTEVLGVSGFGSDVGWLEVGGDSLSAMQVAGRVASHFDAPSTMELLLGSASVSELARSVAVSEEGRPASLSTIERLDPREPAPLSYGQEGIWMDELVSRDHTRYVMPRIIALEGPLDTGILRDALHQIVERHDVLRSTISFDGVVAQTHAKPVEFELTVEHVRAQPDLAELLREESSRPFNLDTDRLLRARVLRVEADRYLLVLAHHHIVSDRTSSRILQTELGSAYNRLIRGQDSPADPLPIQYRDYANWERSWLSDGILDRQLEFWEKAFDGHEPAPAFAGSGEPGVVDTPETINITPGQWSALSAVSRHEGATPFVGFLGAIGRALSSVSGGGDVVVGTTVSRRRRPEFENMIGYFVDMLPIMLSAPPEISWRSSVQAAKHSADASFAHRDAPFSQIMRTLRAAGHARSRRLIDVNFTWDNEMRSQPAFGDVQATIAQSRGQPTRAAISITVRSQTDSAICSVGFGPAVAGTPMADQMVASMERAITMLDRPDEPFE